jgi:hypothetical protein
MSYEKNKLYLVVGFAENQRETVIGSVKAKTYGQAIRSAQFGATEEGDKVVYPQFVFTPAEAELAFDRVHHGKI